MTEPEAGVLLERLSRVFLVPCPKLRWVASGETQQQGFYYPATETIVAGDGTWAGAEPTLLHEFAHHVVRKRYRGLHGKGTSGYHGHYFVECLLEIITYVNGGDRQNYPWRREYIEIRKRVYRNRVPAYVGRAAASNGSSACIDVNKG